MEEHKLCLENWTAQHIWVTTSCKSDCLQTNFHFRNKHKKYSLSTTGITNDPKLGSLKECKVIILFHDLEVQHWYH